MFESGEVKNYETVLPGIRRRTMVSGDRTLMAEFLLSAGSSLPIRATEAEVRS